jgi:beta-mannosidase
MLWWNLRDGWPLISDAVVDYFGRRKLAYAVLRRSHARILPVIAEAAHGRHRIMLVNDTLNPVTGRLVVRRSDQTTLLDIPVTIAADAVCEVAVLPASPFPDCWNCSLMIAGAEPALNHQLVGERPYRLTDLTRWYHELGLSADGVDLAAR